MSKEEPREDNVFVILFKDFLKPKKDLQKRILPRKTIRWFSEQMKLNLCENDHKLDWREIPIENLLKNMVQEISELLTAIEYGDSSGEVIKECADIANFVMMIADNVSHNEGQVAQG